MSFDPTDPHDGYPLRAARKTFIQHKYNTQKESTGRAYKYPTKSFVQYAEDHGVTNCEDVTRGLVNDWIDYRWSEVKPVTVKNNAKHIRVFMKWLGLHDHAPWEIHQRIEIPDVPDGDDVNKDVLREGFAETILEYLETYHYATTYHAVMYLLWHTGCRASGAIALDLGDFDPNPHGDNILRFRDRPETKTGLKNGKKSERDVTISDGLATVLNDYIEVQREGGQDEFGRDPLFTTENGRVSRQRMYKNVVALTRPCVPAGECPHDRDINECKAATHKKSASKCPSSLSLHPTRKGSITHHINMGWPKEALSERVDVSVEVLEKHYDFRQNERKRQNRRQFLHE